MALSAQVKMALAAVALLVAAVLGAYASHLFYAARMQTAMTALQAAEARADAYRTTIEAQARGEAVRERQAASARKDAKEAREALAKALAAHPDWSESAVPADIGCGLKRTCSP